jgi:hypothetical protein
VSAIGLVNGGLIAQAEIGHFDLVVALIIRKYSVKTLGLSA